MIRRPPRSTQSRSSAASDVYKRQRKSSKSRKIGVEHIGCTLASAVLCSFSRIKFMYPTKFNNEAFRTFLHLAGKNNKNASSPRLPAALTLYPSPLNLCGRPPPSHCTDTRPLGTDCIRVCVYAAQKLRVNASTNTLRSSPLLHPTPTSANITRNSFRPVISAECRSVDQ